MESFRLGADHEFVEISLANKIEPEGWFRSPVKIEVGEFVGNSTVYLEISELTDFHKDLIKMHESVSGVAELNTLERQIVLKLVANGRGAIDVEGILWSHATYGSRLNFEFKIDQTYLSEELPRLGRWIQRQTHGGAA